MTISQAINIIKPDNNTLDAVKRAYRSLCKQYHPDVNPNGLELMKLINLAFETLINATGKWDTCDNEEKGEFSINEAMQEILDKISHIADLKIEICGTWLWVSGDTYRYKTALKEAGLRWSKNKVAWYWRPADYKKKSRKTFDMDTIRSRFGSIGVNGRSMAQLA